MQGIRWLQATLLTVGLVFAAYRRTIGSRRHPYSPGDVCTRDATWPVAIGLMVPWLTLLVLAESERHFLWLWPMQVIALAAAVIYIAARIGASRWVPVGSLALVIIVAANPVTLSRLQSWARDGWAGKDVIEVQVENLNRRVEGVSAQDAYRVVQVKELEGSAPDHRP